MALGFGFNKQKSQANAEKFVQQGKLQNAIAEYEKIVQEDPKDLGAVNTIGDLYVRLGQNDKAAQCFKRIGESYTSDGYTLKAIAMYKKLAKLAPDDRDAAVKLAELFTQQGLYTEARSQYMHLAEQYLRNQDLSQATRIFQKMLEIDPDNTSIQTKLAELLIKIGKPEEARDIYSRTAGVLRARGENAAAKTVLDKLLQIDPTNPDALLLKGMLAVESGDYKVAIPLLERVPNLDSIGEALQALLRAYLHTGSLDKAEPLAQVLLSVHKDVSGLSFYAQALLETGDCMHALEIYDEHAPEFIAQDSAALLHALQAAIARIKDNPQGLELLRNIYRKTGETTYNNEVLELLAHAYVQEGKLDRAAQLYQELAVAEPENPLHTQNYKQILARLGNDPIYRAPAQEEGNQAFMIEELEDMARALPQQHPPELEERIQAALTESELFSSYNLPEKAILPLENALAVAPYDIQINQRLASLYTRMKRFDRAADRCEILAQVYGAAGHAEEAAQYEDFVQRYRGPKAAGEAAPVQAAPPPQEAQGFEELTQQDPWQQPVSVVEQAPVQQPVAVSVPVVQQPAPPPAAQQGSVKEFEFEVVQEAAEPHIDVTPVADSHASTHEIDLSNEWEDMMTTEAPAAAPPAATASVLEMKPPQTRMRQPETFEEAPSSVVEKRPPEFEDFGAQPEIVQSQPEPQGFEILPEVPVEPEPEPEPEMPPVDVAAQLVEEMDFYLSQSMLAEAKATLDKLVSEAPNAPQITALRSRLAAKEEAAKPKPVKVEVPKTPAPSIPAPARTATPAKPTVVKISEAKPPVAAEVAETKPAPVAKAPAVVETKPPVMAPPPAVAPPAVKTPPPVINTPVAAPVAKTPAPPAKPRVDDDVLEFSLDDVGTAKPQAVPQKQAPLIEIPMPAPPTQARPVSAADASNLLEEIDMNPVGAASFKPAASNNDLLGNLANDLSESLDGDFLETPALTTTQQASKKISNAAGNNNAKPPAAAASNSAPTGNATQKAAESAQKAAELAAMRPATAKKAAPTDSAAMLSELFDEFKEDVEQQTTEEGDLDTHYNLGAAFREMGLLDEAIGELQKVCNAIEKGAPFDQVIQAYTWLAQCLVERQLPKAAIPWYERALKIPDIGADSLIAIYYDLGSAQEMAGDKKAAADSYTQACSMNIDYRDVVDRLKALQTH